MKKYIFILIAALLTCTVAIAQTDGSKRNKKKKQKTEKVVKKDDSKQNKSGKKQKTEKTVKKDTAPKSESKGPQQQKQYREEPRVSSSYTSDGMSFSIGNVTFEMVRVEGGTFTMGATSEQGSDAWDEEKPAHQVTLSSYYIGKTEVTQALWQAVMGCNPSNFKGSNLPVECVSWDDCQTFIRKLNALTGKNFRLPTEAEWEFAARGGNNSRGYKYSGSNTLSNVAWYCDNSNETTHPVAGKSPNELGIYDMSGNVYEWCSDYYGDYSSSSQHNPTGPSSESYRVSRGGSWDHDAGYCRVSSRGNRSPSDPSHGLGLRLAL